MGSVVIGQTLAEKWSRQYRIYFFCFLSAPKSPKTKRGTNGKFLPKPLLFHLRLPNSKTNEPKFWQILSPKNSFAKTSSALFRHLPEYLEGRTPKKNVLSFLEEISPPPNQRSKEHFSLVLPSEARQWRNDTSVRGSFKSPRAPRVRFSPHQDYQQNTFELCSIHTAK